MRELKAAEFVEVSGGAISKGDAESAGAFVGRAAGSYVCKPLPPIIKEGCEAAVAKIGEVVGGAIQDAATAPTYPGQPPASSYPTDLPTNPGGEPRYNWDTASAGEGGSSYAHNDYSGDSSPSFSTGISNDSIGGAGAHYNPDRFGNYFLQRDCSRDFL